MLRSAAVCALRRVSLKAENLIGTQEDGKSLMHEMSLASFITHVAGYEARLDKTLRAGFRRVGRIVQSEAVREIGSYQGEAAPFAAWAELADSTKDDRVRQGFTENDPGLRTGDMRDSIQAVSDASGAAIGSDDDKLVYFELGTEKQPPRSVLGMAVVHKQDAIERALGGAAVAALTGESVAGEGLPILSP